MPKSIEADTGSLKVYSSAKECEDEIARLFDLVVYRNNSYKDAIENGEKVEEFDPVFIMINSLMMLRSCLSDQSREKLALILEKGSVDYNMTFVIADQAKDISSVSFVIKL